MELLSRGVLCGTDRRQEWLLPWWWSRYAAKNTYPVTFCDFGMSLEARQWCCKRGKILDVEVSFAVGKGGGRQAEWEEIYGRSIWEARAAWFKKPFALLKTPYARTIWLDLDTEIFASLEPLFELAQGHEVCLLKERETDHLPLFHPDVKYNSGVIVYDRAAHLIHRWAERACDAHDDFWGDDPLLSALIHEEKLSVHEMPSAWNWRIKDGLPVQPQIIHWVGEAGKEYIRKWGGLGVQME